MKPTANAYRLLHEGSIALSQIEANGIRIDVPYLGRAMRKAKKKIAALEKKMKGDKLFRRWRRRFGERTKLGSREQLATILFDEMGYESKAKTDTGKHKADQTAFETVDLPFVRRFIKVEKYKKTLSTFLKGIERETVDGILRPVFNLNLAKSYRSSSDTPNFQNLPVRDPILAKIIRRAFIPREGRVLVEIDYSGIEVRVAACYHKDPTMLEYIADKTKDMHRDMAAELYSMPVNQVDKKTRYCAKNMFIFPEFYGSYWKDCAENLWGAVGHLKLQLADGTPLGEHLASKGHNELGSSGEGSTEARSGFYQHICDIETRFWEDRFPVYAQWKEDWWKQWQRKGCFRMFSGFVCDGQLNRKQVINIPIQGAAFHCLLWSLIELQKALNKKKMEMLIVGQIHDSIVADVPVGELQDYLDLAKHVMTVRLRKAWSWIITPLEVEAEVCPEGGTWFDKAEFTRSDKHGWRLK